MLYASSNAQSARALQDTKAAHDARHMALAFAAAVVRTPIKLAAAFVRRRAMDRQIAALEALDDRLLADIGIERWQIRHMVHQGRDLRGLQPGDTLV
jgi:uncharacterized protein YjiS (DUF1127 family)